MNRSTKCVYTAWLCCCGEGRGQNLPDSLQEDPSNISSWSVQAAAATAAAAAAAAAARARRRSRLVAPLAVVASEAEAVAEVEVVADAASP